MPVIEDYSFDINESPQPAVIITSDGTSRGTPVDITSWSIEAVIHAEQGDGIPLRTYTVGSGLAIPVGNDGRLVWTIPNADLRGIGIRSAYYYIARTNAGAEADLRRGAFNINAV